MLPISLSPSSPEPFYQQIVDQVRSLILTGRLEPESVLPSVRALAANLAVSVITTRRAYEELERAGLIVTRPGLGSFVAGQRPEALREARRAQVEARLAEALDEAERLGLPPSEVRRMLESMVREHAGSRPAARAEPPLATGRDGDG